MVLIETKIKDIPRSEIDALESILDKLLTKIGRSDSSGKERTNVKEEHKPFADIRFGYQYGAIKEAVKLEAEGSTRYGDFEVSLKMNLPEEIYSILVDNLNKKAPILTRGLTKASSSSYSIS